MVAEAAVKDTTREGEKFLNLMNSNGNNGVMGQDGVLESSGEQ